MIQIISPVEPIQLERSRSVLTASGYISHYTPNKSRKAEKNMAAIGKIAYKGELLDGALAMINVFICEPPKSNPKRLKSLKHLYKATKPDESNYQKLVEDALEGVIYTNDSRLVATFGVKLYSGYFGELWKDVYADFPKTIIRIYDYLPEFRGDLATLNEALAAAEVKYKLNKHIYKF